MTFPDFRESLDRLGLAQYHDGLVQEAFDSWDVFVDITEGDLGALGVKLGHRRILQRAIAEYRHNGSQSAPAVDQPSAPKHVATKPNGSIAPQQQNNSVSNVPSRVNTGGKRKY